jgi:hypothetical protein
VIFRDFTEITISRNASRPHPFLIYVLLTATGELVSCRDPRGGHPVSDEERRRVWHTGVGTSVEVLEGSDELSVLSE